jgi:hypothetical protein
MSNNDGGLLYSRWTGGTLVVYPGHDGYRDQWFVDSSDGDDANTGKSWEQAFATIATAVAAASAGDAILIRGSFSEAVEVDTAGISIIGCGTREKEAQWTSGADTVSCTISANYVEIANVYFKPPAYASGTPAAIQLGGANHAYIHDCRFQGQTASHNAIYSPVANSDNVRIVGCEFYYMNTATNGAAILGVEAGGLSYSAWHIIGCTFSSCVTAINIGGRVCRIEGNVVMEYGINAAGSVAAVCTTGIDLQGDGTGSDTSGGNMVVGNYLAGAYNTSGLYVPGASGDLWAGNFSPKTSETEVGDNGVTISPPAAA